MKFTERAIVQLINDGRKLDGTQFCFVHEKNTTDANFLVRQLQENLSPIWRKLLIESHALLSGGL